MARPLGSPLALSLGAAIALAVIAPVERAGAMCNVIPAATVDFRSGVGSANRPFASPGDVVEVRVRPAVCDGNSTGYVDLDGDGSRSDDHVVTVLFTPPDGTRNAVVLAESCAGIALAGCDAELGGGTTTCVEVNGVGEPVGLADGGQNALQLRFPDTDARLDALNDDRTLAGPAKIVVTRRGGPLACQLATQRCADAGDTLSSGVVACVDEFYQLDGTCRTDGPRIDRVFGHFTALPPPVSLERMVSAPGITEVHLTTDAAGNALFPLDYTDLMVRIEGRPVPFISRAGASLDAFSGEPFDKIDIPSGWAASYSPEGIVLPPVFSPLTDPTSPTDAVLFGSLDAPRGVLRIARRLCVGGTQEGLTCSASAQCAGGGSCPAAIFDLGDRYLSGVGPVALAPGQFTAARETPITLESVALKQASGSFAFVVYEGFDGEDRNGDGDATDFVLTLRDAESGLLRPIGPSGSEGRALVQVREGRFSAPALETVGSRVAFLESEPAQAGADANGNGEVFDSVLRIYELGPTQATELTGAPVTAEPARVVGGRIGAWVGDRLFFRTAEAREAGQGTTRVSATPGGGEPNAYSEAASFGLPPRGPAASANGRYVVFNSAASDLTTDANGARDCFVRDRDTDDDGILDEPGAVSTEIASVATGGAQGNAGSDECVLSASGRYVAFVTVATNLDSGGVAVCDGGAPGGCEDVIVRDRVAGTTERVSLDVGGGEPNEGSLRPSISADGRFVAFESEATDLVAGDTNGQIDVFVRDRCRSEGVPVAGCIESTIRVSVDSNGDQFAQRSEWAAISADGRVVVFNRSSAILAHDRDADGDGAFDEPGAISTAVAGPGAFASVSGDGRFVAFESASALVPGDTNSVFDVFVVDRELGTTERVSVSSDGMQGSRDSAGPFISQDARLVAFWSVAPDLVLPDQNVCPPLPGVGECRDILVHDRLTRATRRVSESTANGQANLQSHAPSISPDGRFVVFESTADNLVPGDGAIQDVFVRGVDTGDLTAEHSGDGRVDDAVLRAADVSGGPAVLGDRCPADAGDAEGAYVAFLRPEAAGPAGPPCSQGDPDRNADGDTRDRIVHLDDGVTVRDWRCPASEVALSATLVAALVPEADQGLLGVDWSLDGDVEDRVLAVRALADADPASCADWGPTAHAGVALDVMGDVVALLTNEADLGLGGTNLNGDADVDPADRVLRLFGATGSEIPLVDAGQQSVDPQQAQDFVMAGGFVALRTRESEQSNGACSLNGDADCLDDVLQLYVPSQTPPLEAELVNTGQAIVPCTLPECDPLRPYRVSDDTVRFLTFESDQGEDLNQDGDQLDLLVQVYNARARVAEVIAEVVDPVQLAQATGTALVPGTGSDPLAAPSENAPSEQTSQVVLALGRCVEDRETSCSTESSCDPGDFCFAELGQAQGSCVRDTGATCYPDRPAGEQGCLAGAVCARDFVVLAIADRDADQLADAIDNCPGVANTAQLDADQDGVGDGCDLQTCGNAELQLDEECDDGNLVDGDTCDSNCRLPLCGNGIQTGDEACDDGNLLPGDGCSPACGVEECSNGVDDDGDGDADFGADPGCENLADLSEGNPEVDCDDGEDNDGDGRTDYRLVGGDPGCFDASSRIENPKCQDGLNNDNLTGIDFDGGDSLDIDPRDGFIDAQFNAATPAVGGVDPQCAGKPWANKERSGCGLGFEVVFLAPLLARLARRRPA